MAHFCTFGWTCVFYTVIVALSSANFPAPPSIIVHPQTVTIVSSEPVTLECHVSGYPEPDVTWMKNGAPVLYTDHVSMTYLRSRGQANLDISTATNLNEGYYQCIAENQYGKSMSGIAQIIVAVLGSFPTAEVNDVTVTEGESLRLECMRPKSVPAAVYTWNIREPDNEDHLIPITLEKRTQMDQEGNLLFSFIAASDGQSGRQYVCNAYNSVTMTSKGGSLHVIHVLDVPSKRPSRPSIMFSTPSNAVGLVGQELELQCIFSGFNKPSVAWTKLNSKLPNNHKLKNYSTTLSLTALTFDMEGTYVCYATNIAGTSERTEIAVRVEAKPAFVQQPEDMYGTVGEEATVLCHATGKPSPRVEWYINGNPVDTQSPPIRMLFENHGTTLYIRNLCKECRDRGTGDRLSDIMVIQCNASNIHGYVFGQGFLNVINSTEIYEAPPTQYTIALDEVQLELPCKATTDLSTNLTVTWYKGTDTIRSLGDDRIEVELDNTLYIDLYELELKDKAHYEDQYKCVASNGHSTAEAVTHVVVEGAPKPIIQSASFPWWWIVVVIAILLLLLIIILCCCLCASRNKGDDYNVDYLEKKSGIYPEKENRENDFKEYQRPDDGPVRGSRASLTSTVQLDSDDDGMADEYGDPDAGKFTEEGSFIGQYDTNRAKQSLV